MKVKHILLIFLLSFALLLIGAQVRYRSLLWDIPISQILFAVTTFILVRKNIMKGKWIYVLMPFSILFWDIFAFIFDNTFSISHEWQFLSIGTPNFLFCMIGATYGVFFAAGTKLRIAGVALLLLSAVFSAWYMVKGNEYWYNYCFNGPFTGKTEGSIASNWQHVVNPSDTLQKDYYQDKLVVLDFWGMSCVVCFQKFPKLDSLNREYKHDNRVVFTAVNLPERDDSAKYERTRLLHEKYTFKTVFADSSAGRIFNIDGVPTVIVLKNDQIVFRGSIELAKDFLAEQLKNK